MSAIRLLLAVLAFCAIAGASALAASGTPTAAHPQIVHVALMIRNLTAIDEVKENWQATGLLIAKWNVPRFRYQSRDLHDTHRDLLPAAIWTPSFEFTNEVSATPLRYVDLYARPDGTVELIQGFNAVLSTALDLRRFPFDSQRLPVVIEARGDDLDRTILVPDLPNSSIATGSYAGLAQWKPLAITATPGVVAGSAGNAKNVEFGVRVQRNSNSYIWKFILPLLLLVIVSWVTFWLSHEEFKTKDQLQSAVATLLIVVAFNVAASNLLPRTNYITYIDALLFTCFSFVVISIGAIVATHLLELNHSAERALLIRRLAGAVLPIAFIITQAMLFFSFRIEG